MHWTQVLYAGRGPVLQTAALTQLTYALMVEDERQYEIAEQRAKKSLAFDPDAKIKAEFMAKGRDFVRDMAAVKIVW